MLSHDDIAKLLLKPVVKKTAEGVYYDVQDGGFLANKEAEQNNHPYFYILVFQDGLEMCNPLGNRKGKHNLVKFYWTLLNFPPRLRSKLSAIRMFSSVNKTLLSEYGFDAVLKPFFDEMKALLDGVEFIIKGEPTKCFGRVILCLGDTEGQHQISGFKVGVGFSLRKCRFCFATVEDVRGNLDRDSFRERNLTSHLRQCKALQDAPSQRIRDEISTTLGINYLSCLHNLPDFDVTKQFPHDIMHVLLESIVPYECQLALSALMDQGLFNLDEFNAQLDKFTFTQSDMRSKPEGLKASVFVTGERKLKYSAENSRIFLKVLPFLLEQFVHEDDPFLLFLLELCSIVCIAYSPVINDGLIICLEELVAEHYENFNQLFPEFHLIPKHHYLLEIPRHAFQFGPPVRWSCMRFEALHKRFKSFAPVASFQNLPMSLANRYVRYEAMLQDGPEHPILSSSRIDGPGIKLDDYKVNFLRQSYPALPRCESIFSLKWLTFYGNNFTVDKSIVAVGAENLSHLPIFGKLRKILLCKETIFFLIDELKTSHFDTKFIGYSVVETNEQSIWSVDQLLDYNAYQIVKTMYKKKLIVPLKYDLSTIIEEHLKGHNPMHA
ncbi:uncharacterized protein [Clytia hemisphaerica]|uniref:uncharacterized protein n=1 Tax=Clytia hemisphaerica TaxID=252671 RepID=UPI0034D3B2EF